MSKREKKRQLASRHDSRRYLKHHPPKKSAPSAAVTALAQMAVDSYPRRRGEIRQRWETLSLPSRRRGPSAERVMLQSLPSGPAGEAYLAVEYFVERRGRRLDDPALVADVARKLWVGGIGLVHNA